MKVLIESPFKINDLQNQTIKDNLNSLEKYNQGITRAQVYFKTDDGNIANAIEAKIELHLPGPVIFVSEEDQDAMVAFKGALDKADRQLRKNKDVNQQY